MVRYAFKPKIKRCVLSLVVYMNSFKHHLLSPKTETIDPTIATKNKSRFPTFCTVMARMHRRQLHQKRTNCTITTKLYYYKAKGQHKNHKLGFNQIAALFEVSAVVRTVPIRLPPQHSWRFRWIPFALRLAKPISTQPLHRTHRFGMALFC